MLSLCLLPAAASWSRARHFGDGQKPLRSRAELFGLQSLDLISISLAIQKFTEEIGTNPELREHLPRLSGTRLACHCLPTQECHADSVNAEYKL